MVGIPNGSGLRVLPPRPALTGKGQGPVDTRVYRDLDTGRVFVELDATEGATTLEMQDRATVAAIEHLGVPALARWAEGGGVYELGGGMFRATFAVDLIGGQR